MIIFPLIFVFLLGVVFGIWVFNPMLRKYVIAQVANNDSEKESAAT